MKKVVGLLPLLMIMHMGYGAQQLTIRDLAVQDLNITTLPDSDVEGLFQQSFRFNKKGYEAYNVLATRRGLRRMSESTVVVHPHRDNESPELSVGMHLADLHVNDQSQLEEVLPAMQDPFDRFLNECTIPEKRRALRIIKSAQDDSIKTIALNKMLETTRSLYQSVRENQNIGQGIALGGTVLLASSYAASNKAVFANADGGFLSMLPQMIGGAGSALIAFWAYEKYIGVMEGVRLMSLMKKDIGGWVDDTKKIKKEFAKLKKSYDELKQEVNEAIVVTQEVNQHMPSIVALSDDHNTLAGIMQMLLQKAKTDEKKIAQLQECLLALAQHGNFSDEAQELLQDSTVASRDMNSSLTPEEQKLKIVQKYNKQSMWNKVLGKKPRVAVFDDIPQEWFKKHDKELNDAGYTIRPSLAD